MAVMSRRVRSVVLLFALTVASRADGAGDSCMDIPDHERMLATPYPHRTCYFTGYYGGCDALEHTPACAWTCGKCDRYFPMPECEPDEIATNKERLCKFLLDTKLVPECVVNATRTWQDFQLFDPLELGNAHLSTQSRDADPCYSAHADDIGLAIKCDRCGEVRTMNFSPTKLPPVSMDGEIPDDFFTFKKLSFFMWLNIAERSVPFFTLPQNHTLLEFPVLTWWQTIGIKMTMNQLSSSSLVNLQVYDVWGGRADDVQFSRKCTQISIGSYADDAGNNYEGATWSSLGHDERYNGSTSVVGNIPESICSPYLGSLIITMPSVSGPVPPCLADSLGLAQVSIKANLRGSLAPLLVSPILTVIQIKEGADCNGSSLPSFLSNMKHLQYMSIRGCGLVGDVPDITSPLLSHLDLADNLLQGAGKLSGSLLKVNLSGNLIEQWPTSWNDLTGVAELDLTDNPLGEWPLAGVIPQSQQHTHSCEVHQTLIVLAPRFHWPDIRSLTLNNCPLNLSVRDFLYSLTYTSIKTLEARNCSLHGGVDEDASSFVPDRPTGHADQCSYRPGFRSLSSLSLSNNKVEYFNGAPWPSLFSIDLAHNLLEFLHPHWFSGSVTFVDLKGNPGFRAKVSPPPADRRCPEGTMGGLVADPTAFTEALHRSDMECTSLCASGYFPSVDGTTSESLCRPVCQIGWYREEKTSPSCTLCPQWPAQTTTDTGSISINSCKCSSEYTGLRAIAMQCGCDDGYFMKNVTKTCAKCSYAETCTWGADIGSSLLPPRIRPGFWIDPASHTENFSGNDVWRCRSKVTCELEGKCAPGRGGVACSLCLPGKYGGPDGQCRDCPGSEEYHWFVGILAIVGMSPFLFALHAVVVGSSNSRSILLTLRALRRSLRQMVRQIQAVAIVAGYSVNWPPLAKDFFDALGRFSIEVPSWAGAACFGSEQSATVEMVFRWVTPVALALSALVAVPLSRGGLVLCERFLPRMLVKVHPAPDQLHMTLWDAVRVFVFCSVMFYATLLDYSFMIFMCATSPNGNNTVVDFPHLKCSFREPEYFVLAVGSVVFIMFTLGGLFGSILYAFFQHVREWAKSNFSEHGWWGFLFEDFRSTRSYWLLVLMVRDVCLVMVRMVSAGNGLAQLFTASLLSCIISVSVMADSPYVDFSNTLMEAWNHAAVAFICLYTAGLGYESTPGVGESSQLYADGEDDEIYRTRAIGMFVAQVLSFFVPCLIMFYQLMLLIPHIRRRLPRIIRPFTDEQNKAWLTYLVNSLNFRSDDDGAALTSLLEKLDNVEFGRFRHTISSSMATINIAGLDDSGSLSPRAYVKRKASDVVKRTLSSKVPDCAASSGELAPAQPSDSAEAKADVIGCSSEADSSHRQRPSHDHSL